jgi:UDP-glucose 4-epimerase
MTFSQFSGQKVLVTGASGFIGSHLCHSLRENNAEVHGVSRRGCFNGEHNIHWWHGDLTSTKKVREFITTIKPDVIFHLASYVLGARSFDVVLPTFYSNLHSTVNLLLTATEVGCRRIILTGSLEEPESDNMGTIPSSPYAVSKWASSAYARMFHALYQTPVVIARLFMVYGGGQQDLKKLIPYMILSLLRRQVPKLSSGKREIDWIYVEDVVEGLLAIAQAPNIEGKTIDLGSGKLVSIQTIAKLVTETVGSPIEPLFSALPDRQMEQIRVANTEKTYAAIGWKPKTSLEEGLELTVKWYKEYLAAQLTNGV